VISTLFREGTAFQSDQLGIRVAVVTVEMRLLHDA
jgi:hypothetical protein